MLLFSALIASAWASEQIAPDLMHPDWDMLRAGAILVCDEQTNAEELNAIRLKRVLVVEGRVSMLAGNAAYLSQIQAKVEMDFRRIGVHPQGVLDLAAEIAHAQTKMLALASSLRGQMSDLPPQLDVKRLRGRALKEARAVCMEHVFQGSEAIIFSHQLSVMVREDVNGLLIDLYSAFPLAGFPPLIEMTDENAVSERDTSL